LDPAFAVDIRSWSEDDLALLERLMGDSRMTEHLGGPESPEKIRQRHERYLRGIPPGEGQMFVIVVGEERLPAGNAGYWVSDWDDSSVWETGWSVLPEFQGRGIATSAVALVLQRVQAEQRFRYIHAFPSVENAPSNAICRKLGFDCLGEFDIEYPPGTFMRANNWRFDLAQDRPDR
jgi:RimJ/RimL family protein N-acetyltransferase